MMMVSSRRADELADLIILLRAIAGCITVVAVQMVRG